MQHPITSAAVLSLLVVLSTTCFAQPQPVRPPDGPLRDEAATTRDRRPGDDAPPPPGKGGPRPKGDAGDKRGAFYEAGGYAPRPGGSGGFGGYWGGAGSGGGFAGGMSMPRPGPNMPGLPFPFGDQSPDDPEMRDILRQDMEMERTTHDLARRIHEARGEERPKLKAELSEIVNKHFDVRQKRRELQLKRMEDELQRLREAIATRNKSRDTIVTNHIKELVGEERDLEF